jgi:hypothetical protein
LAFALLLPQTCHTANKYRRATTVNLPTSSWRCAAASGAAQRSRQRVVAVADEEECRVQRDEQIDDELEGDLAETERLCGDPFGQGAAATASSRVMRPSISSIGRLQLAAGLDAWLTSGSYRFNPALVHSCTLD